MGHIWQIVITIGIVIGALAGIGAAIALVVGNFNKARSDAIRQDNEDLQNRVNRLEHENEKLTINQDRMQERWAAEQARMQAELDAARKDNERLEELVTQRADVASVMATVGEVLTLVSDHNQKAERWWTTMDNHNRAEEALMGRLVKSMADVAERLKSA